MAAREEGVWGQGKEIKGNKRYKLPVIKEISHREEKSSTGKRVNNPTVTLFGDRWRLYLLW